MTAIREAVAAGLVGGWRRVRIAGRWYWRTPGRTIHLWLAVLCAFLSLPFTDRWLIGAGMLAFSSVVLAVHDIADRQPVTVVVQGLHITSDGRNPAVYIDGGVPRKRAS